MRWMKRVIVIFILALTAQTWAAGVDDQYLDIYNQILQAEASLQDGRSDVAAQQFLDAQNALQKFRDAHSGWNPDLVAFRLQYLNGQLKALGKSAAPGAAPPATASGPAQTPGLAESRQVIATLRQQLRSLSAAYADLQNKLHEALSVQPAAVDPRELAKAEDQIVQLQKQRDLLAASLDEEKKARARPAATPKPASEGQTANLKQLAKERDHLAKECDELKKNLAANASRLADAQSRNAEEQRAESRKLQQAEEARGQLAKERDDLAKERDELKKDLSARASELAAQSRHEEDQRADSRKLKQAQKERDELQKKVALLSESLQKRPSNSIAPQNEPMLQQNEQLRARLAVLEASAVPYTAQELAFLKQGQSQVPAPAPGPGPTSAPVAATSETKRTIHSVKDLPPGAGALMADGLRAANERDYDQAEKKFNAVLRQDENNVYVLANLASAQFAAGKLDACEKNVRRALVLDPDDSGSLYLLGILRFRQDKLDEALDALSRSAKINPTNAATQNYLGCVLSDKGLRKPAETALRKALELEPDYPEAHYNLGWVYASEKPPFLALARWHYQRAIDNGHPRNPAMEKLLTADGNEAH